jgi:predicted nucleotidyltransferase
MVKTDYKIYLDLDGVLADWEKQFETYTGMTCDEYELKFGKDKRIEFVLKNSPNFYASMDWMSDGKILYNFAKEFPCEILSHSTDDQSTIGKLNWLKNNGIKLKPNLVSKREDKSKFANAKSIMVDDRQDVIDAFKKAGGIGILHTNSIDTINQLKNILGVKESYRIYNSILNPEIWNNDVLKTEVLEKLLKISTSFYKDTELTAPIEDILFLGSTAGYNWTPTSDIDLHVLIDFSKIDENKELVKKLVDAYKNKWNEQHNLSINSHPVELYIQDINDVNRSQAVYSVLNNCWIKKPSYEDLTIDKESIKLKFKQYAEEIDKIINQDDVDGLKDMIKRLYDMRESGLVSGGEYSTENLVFKLLRSKGYISKLRSNINKLVDKKLNKIEKNI